MLLLWEKTGSFGCQGNFVNYTVKLKTTFESNPVKFTVEKCNNIKNNNNKKKM